MALMKVYNLFDKEVRQVAKPVAEVTDEIRTLLDDMIETMAHEKGVGIAATQVGRLERVFVMDWSHMDEYKHIKEMKLVNPEITWMSEETQKNREGCLSVPGAFAEVTRAQKIKFTYLDETGKRIEAELEGLPATCVQHEIDHLDGKLFIDHVPALKRKMILNKLRKSLSK